MPFPFPRVTDASPDGTPRLPEVYLVACDHHEVDVVGSADIDADVCHAAPPNKGVRDVPRTPVGGEWFWRRIVEWEWCRWWGDARCRDRMRVEFDYLVDHEAV